MEGLSEAVDCSEVEGREMISSKEKCWFCSALALEGSSSNNASISSPFLWEKVGGGHKEIQK